MVNASESPRRISGSGSMISRRDLLIGLGIGVPGAYVLAGCAPTPAATYPKPQHSSPDPAPFLDGVIAGDPMPDGSVIWTRIDPPAGGASVGVLWSVSTDPTFETVAAGGVALAEASGDHCVHVRVDGLEADSWYFYRFEAEGVASRIGRLRTAPAAGADVSHLRFAFASCQQLNDSWFNAHLAAAEDDIDFFVHLGDYVYVSDGGTITLDDYRRVYHRWRREPQLREFHAKVPMVALWDDGEFYNGVDRTGDPARLAAARRAWFENMPVINPGEDRVYRSLSWGKLADLPIIDTRAYRDPYIGVLDHTQGPGAATSNPSRTQLGAEQYAWLVDELKNSTASWRLVGNGVPISPWRLVNLEFLRPFRPDMPANAGLYASSDGWDDYAVERRDLLAAMLADGVTDTIFVTGQTHISIVSELRPDPDAGGPLAAFEFVSPSMTADPDVRRSLLGDLPLDVASGVLRLAEDFLLQQNPGMHHLNFEDQGYVLVDVTPQDCVVQYRCIDTYNPNAVAFTGAKFRVAKGSEHLEVLHVDRHVGSTN